MGFFLFPCPFLHCLTKYSLEDLAISSPPISGHSQHWPPKAVQLVFLRVARLDNMSCWSSATWGLPKGKVHYFTAGKKKKKRKHLLFSNLQTRTTCLKRKKVKGPHLNFWEKIAPLKWMVSPFLTHTQYFKKEHKHFQVTFCASHSHLTWWKWKKEQIFKKECK